MMLTRTLLMVVLMAAAGGAWAAQPEPVTGVVTHVDSAKNMLTIRNDTSGQRRTYFLDDATRITADGRALDLRRVRKGHTVTLYYRQTDAGRVVETLRVPRPDEIVEVIPVEMTEVLTLSGRVTAVRPSLRTITIRDDETRARRTIKVPQDVQVTRDGRPLSMFNIERGDAVTARYRITDRGLILVTGRSPASAKVDATPAPLALPKTASDDFIWLFLGLGLIVGGVAVRILRASGARG